MQFATDCLLLICSGRAATIYPSPKRPPPIMRSPVPVLFRLSSRQFMQREVLQVSAGAALACAHNYFVPSCPVAREVQRAGASHAQQTTSMIITSSSHYAKGLWPKKVNVYCVVAAEARWRALVVYILMVQHECTYCSRDRLCN